MTFAEAEKSLGKRESKRIPPGHNTRLERIDADTIGVRLHSTYVVKIHRDGTYTLDSGGWRTVTTKARMREYSPVRLWQESSIWKLCGPVVPGKPWPGAVALFDDGIRVDAQGQPIPPFRAHDADDAPKKRLDRMVRAYIKGFAADALANGLENPGGGDCWGCHMRADDVSVEAMGYGHYLSHFRESYYVPSLLWNALQRCGNPSFVWSMISADLQRGRTDLMERELRSFFRKMKPALLAALVREGDTVPA